MTGRVLPQDGGLEALSGSLGAGWGQMDIAGPSCHSRPRVILVLHALTHVMEKLPEVDVVVHA